MKQIKSGARAALFALFLFALGLLAAPDSSAAGFSVYAGVGIGDTLQLRTAGAGNYTWSSSDDAVATVSETGLVSGKGEGDATITAKNKKKTIRFRVAVKKTPMDIREIGLSGGGDYICFKGEDPREAELYIDGKKVDTTVNLYEGKWYVRFKKLSEGKHTFVIKKKNKKDYTCELSYEMPKVDGIFATKKMFPGWAKQSGNGINLWINPKIQRSDKKTVLVDGEEAIIWEDSGITGYDGYYLISVKMYKPSPTKVFSYSLNNKDFHPTLGEHVLTIRVDGFGEESYGIIIAFGEYNMPGYTIYELKKSAGKTAANATVKVLSDKAKKKSKKKTTLDVNLEIGVRETLQMLSEGSDTVRWHSSKKSVATVNKDGLIRGRQKGTTTITATDKATGNIIRFKVVVAYEIFRICDEKINNAGNAFLYNGNDLAGTQVTLDGQTIEVKFGKSGGADLGKKVTFEGLTEGEHVLVFHKDGYKDYVYEFNYKIDRSLFMKRPTVWEDYIRLNLNSLIPADPKITVTVDGISHAVKHIDMVDASGTYRWVDVARDGLAPGKHTIHVVVEGFGEESIEITEDDFSVL